MLSRRWDGIDDAAAGEAEEAARKVALYLVPRLHLGAVGDLL